MSGDHLARGWTRHGHPIVGQVQVFPRPPIARCGGPRICAACALDAALPPITKATAYTPQPGDMVVLEVSTDIDRQQMDAITEQASQAFGGAKVVVLVGAKFVDIERKGRA